MSSEIPAKTKLAETTAAAAPEPTKTTEPAPAPTPAAVPAAPTADFKKETLDTSAPPAPGAIPAAPAATAAPISSSEPTWPALDGGHPLSIFLADLPSILSSTGHNEVYGVTLKPKAGADATPDFHTLLILQKFLRANMNDLTKAKEQLSKTLAWRKEFDPVKAMNETFSSQKFSGLGYVTVIPDPDEQGKKQVVTWNIYGAVKDFEKTFVPLDEFIRWRIALMEFGVSKLNLTSATVPIPDYANGPDPYQGIQVHDYLNVSFLRMDPRAKAASKKTIELLSEYYPETLSRKFFVNVPLLMQWMFSAMNLFVKSAETKRKFVALSYGKYVVDELGDGVPEEYGGKAGSLASVGEGLKMDDK